MSLSQQTIAAVRFGYGVRPGEAVADPDAMLAGVRMGARAVDPTEPGLAGRLAQFEEMRVQAEAEGMAATNRRFAVYRADVQRRVCGAVLSPYGFYERLVWFWADHFTVVGKNQRGRMAMPSFEAEAIRPHVGGRFADLLRAAVTHPLMLAYLDQARSVGPNSPAGRKARRGLNENLAREVLELHTLGVEADYGQADVGQFAELLTGLTTDMVAGRMEFRAGRAEPGPETVLGRRYGGGAAGIADIHAVLDDLAVHPSTARHVARKLAVHFVADDPPPGLVDHLEAAYRRSYGDLAVVYAALLEHPESWTDPGAKVRQPFDLVVASLRAAAPRNADEVAACWRPTRSRGRRGPAADEPAALERARPGRLARGRRGLDHGAGAHLPDQLGVAHGRGARRADRPAQLPRRGARRAGARRDRRRRRGAAERWEGIALAMASPEFNRR